MKKSEFFTLGLMSGTSVDAIDAALLQSNKNEDRVLLHLQFQYPKKLRKQILAMIREPNTGLENLARVHYEIGNAFAEAAKKTLTSAVKKKLLRTSSSVHSIGSHGQTIFHDPIGKRTLQIGEASLISAATGITTVSDFRVADTAVGGEGAPLLPYYHQRIFGHSPGRAVHNLGGISNFTYLGPKGKILAMDTGPANCLLDEAMLTLSRGKFAFDRGGSIAKLGRISKELLSFLKKKPDILSFRKKHAPKSTGRELFSSNLLALVFREYGHLLPEDLLHTLSHFTVDLIVESYEKEILQKKLPLKQIIFAGGGSKNTFLLRLLREKLPAVEIKVMEDFGWNSQSLEAQAFGYFSWMAIRGIPLTFPTTTGAKEGAICGKISPGKNWGTLMDAPSTVSKTTQ